QCILVVAYAHKSRALSVLLDVLRESSTHIGFTGPPQLHLHDLGCQPIAALRLSQVFQDELQRIEQRFDHWFSSSRPDPALSTIALKASRGKPWVERSCLSADIGIPLSREPISMGETSPAASQNAACFAMSFMDPVTERFSALAN